MKLIIKCLYGIIIGEITAGQRIRKMHVFGEINKMGDYILHLAKKYPDSVFEGVEIDQIQYQRCLIKKQEMKLNNVNFILGDLTEAGFQ
jgi:hypothetical protein